MASDKALIPPIGTEHISPIGAADAGLCSVVIETPSVVVEDVTFPPARTGDSPASGPAVLPCSLTTSPTGAANAGLHFVVIEELNAIVDEEFGDTATANATVSSPHLPLPALMGDSPTCLLG